LKSYGFKNDSFQSRSLLRIFQEAVKEHQAKAMEDLEKLFAKMGVNLHHV
jgi:hypothetical protein